jgi:predicted alpha/beta superfamily hydrolase
MNIRPIIALLLVMAWSSPLPAKAISFESKPIILGQTITLQSKVMGEARTINVWLPPSYAKGKQAYPVLYVIDGGLEQDFVHVTGTAQLGMIWGRNVEAIIVGIETKDRRKELIGTTQDTELLKKYSTAGQSAQFRRFIREEVKPLVERQFRTGEYDTVIGESLAGLFIVESWLDEPDLFDGYAAISPSLWWDAEALSRRVAALPADRMSKQPRLYLNIANEGREMQAGVDRVVGVLGPVANWCYAPRPDLTHATIYQQTEAPAIQFLLPSPYAKETEGFEVKCANRAVKAADGD